MVRVALTTLGCKVNQYDTATIEDRLKAVGHVIVAFNETADVYIINSCTVTNQADAESRQLARRARRTNPAARVIMTGCYAQVNPLAVAKMPEVDHVIGLNRLDDMLRAVKAELAERIAVSNLRKTASSETPGIATLGAVTFSGQTRAFLKIQEGCDLFCTFCIVPMSRGKSRSVPPRIVLEQLDRLAAQGFQEVVLTGIHLGGYGEDLDPPVTLTWLLEAIEERRPVPRVRVSSIDPHEISDDLMHLLGRSAILCPHLHIPIQAGDDTVLARMRRRYDTALARDVLTRLRTLLPHAALGTDFIVGFPGEGEDEFARSLTFLEESPFTYFHVFPYSVRSGTTAAKFRDKVPQPVIAERARLVRKLGAVKKAQFARSFLGQTLPVLFEHTRDKSSGNLKGYSRNYLRVQAPGGDDLMNREVLVKITRTNGETLWGEILAENAAYGMRRAAFIR
ncbi:MAG TPA: tRNA (N(6)-L-threonylcarbamoyladenosine(37)-C(2))-methylthiotransferase MtaB [Methylomirabilota bacterium]|jgi:threonylcarbamoyladenosine tRNA methylthiotransferase MtaB|nr:tRNA (N(6)-L-threonylcarbamoyladenosine(37)-C(2))-methylthiotransferase MtaB [Methylomirabilota bacterium]